MTHSATQQVEQITKTLAQLYVRRDEAQAIVDDCNKQITAFRNVLAGVSLGTQLAAEANADKTPADPASKPEEAPPAH